MFDQVVAELAATQYGVFARFQLLELGLSSETIKRRIRAGLWHRLAPGVYGLPGHRDTDQRRIWIAYLTAGRNALVSHDTAAAEFRWPGFRLRNLHLTVPHPEHQRVRGATVHQTRVLPRHHWIVFAGRRTTTMARTLVDIAPTASRKKLALAYEDGIVTRHLSHSKASRCLMELMSPGRKGLRKLGSVLDDRGPGYVAPASELERVLFELVVRAGLPEPVRQFPHPGRQGINGCVDAAFVEPKLILEADGRRWHTRLDDFARDAARDKQAARAGWQTLRFIFEELVGDPEDSCATLLDVYNQRISLDLWRK